MRTTVTFGFNQIISHGFGLFLFAALVPLMQADIGISHWHLAAVGALTQLAYLAGAMMLGVIGRKVDSGRLLLLTGTLTSLLLFSMALLNNPNLMLVVLTVMAASAAVSWGGIVELVTCYGRPDQNATSLSTASSGTAWGYGLNGLLILVIVPLLGWRSGWLLAGALGLLTVLVTARVLRGIDKSAVQLTDLIDAPQVVSTRELFRTVLRERTAFSASLVCFLVGFSAMPYSTWLNTWLAEQSLPPALGGYAWTIAGLTGMAAGFLVGKLADKKGHGLALFITCAGFAIAMLAFIHNPARFAVLAGFGYGLMYFPMWGIVAGWVSKRYHSKATMQISGVGMVTFGLGGALGNLLAGSLQQVTGSLQAMYWVIGGTSLVLTMLAANIWQGERRIAPPLEPVL